MRRILLVTLMVLAASGQLVSSAWAQGGSTKSGLSGSVLDSGGGVIPGATVDVKHLGTGVTTTTTRSRCR
jgi:hypothetical protein